LYLKFSNVSFNLLENTSNFNKILIGGSKSNSKRPLIFTPKLVLGEKYKKFNSNNSPILSLNIRGC
jgi:hypothetical protein